MQDVGNANLSPRIPTTLPLRNGCRLQQIVDALLDEHAHHGGSQALAHRPAFERGSRCHALAIALADEASLPRHYEGCCHSCSRLEGGVHSSFDLGSVDLLRQWVVGQRITHGPSLRRGFRQLALDDDWRETDGVLAHWKRHAPLAPKILGGASHAIWQCDVNGLVDAIDHRLCYLRALRVRAREISDVPCSKV